MLFDAKPANQPGVAAGSPKPSPVNTPPANRAKVQAKVWQRTVNWLYFMHFPAPVKWWCAREIQAGRCLYWARGL